MSLASRMVAFLRTQYFRVLQRQRDSRHARRHDRRDRWLVDTLEPRVMLSGTASLDAWTDDSHFYGNEDYWGVEHSRSYFEETIKTTTTTETKIEWTPTTQSRNSSTRWEETTQSESESKHVAFINQPPAELDDWHEDFWFADTRFASETWENHTVENIGGQWTVTSHEDGSEHTDEGETSYENGRYKAESSEPGDFGKGTSRDVWGVDEYFDYHCKTTNTLDGTTIVQTIEWHDDGVTWRWVWDYSNGELNEHRDSYSPPVADSPKPYNPLLSSSGITMPTISTSGDEKWVEKLQELVNNEVALIAALIGKKPIDPNAVPTDAPPGPGLTVNNPVNWWEVAKWVVSPLNHAIGEGLRGISGALESWGQQGITDSNWLVKVGAEYLALSLDVTASIVDIKSTIIDHIHNSWDAGVSAYNDSGSAIDGIMSGLGEATGMNRVAEAIANINMETGEAIGGFGDRAKVLFAGVLTAASVGRKGMGPGKWVKTKEAMSDRAKAYQGKITGRPGESYRLNGVKFDGFRNGVLLEAKGPGYANKIKNGQFQGWFRGKKALEKQAEHQVKAAKLADGSYIPITWHVAEKKAADAMRNLLKQYKGRIDIVHTPVL